MTYMNGRDFGSAIPDFLKYSAHDPDAYAHRARKRVVDVSEAIVTTRRAVVALLTLPTAKRSTVKAARLANRRRIQFEKR